MFARSVLFDIGFNIRDKKLKRANKDISILKRNVRTGSSHFATLGATGYTAGAKIKTMFANVGTKLKAGVATLRKYRYQILGVTAAFGLFAANSIKQAGDAQETINKFNVVFGNTADQTRKWATNWADAVGRSRIQTLDWLNSFQDILVPMGLARDEAGNLSKEMVKLSADLGSFNNVPTERAARAMQSALMGQHRAVRQLGISLNQARLDELALAEGHNENFKNLDALTKMQLRFQEMQRQSSDAIGDLIRTKQDFNNQLQQIKGNFKDASAEMGNSFIPSATKVLQISNKILKKFKDPEWAEFGASITKMGLSLGTLALGIPVLTKIAGFIKTGFVAAFSGASGIILAAVGLILGGFLLLDDALTAIEGGDAFWFSDKTIDKAYGVLDIFIKVRGILLKIVNALKWAVYFIGDIFELVGNIGRLLIAGFTGENIIGIFKDIGAEVSDIGKHIGLMMKNIFSMFDKTFKALGINFKKILSGVWGWIKTSFNNVIQWIGNKITGILNIGIKNINKTIGLYNSTLGKVTGEIGTIKLLENNNTQGKTTPLKNTPAFSKGNTKVTENQNFSFNINVNGTASPEEKQALDKQMRNIMDEYFKQSKAEVQA